MLQCWRKTVFALFFLSPPRGIWQLKSPQPLEFTIQGQSGGGGGEAGCSWSIFLWILDMAQEVHFDIAT